MENEPREKHHAWHIEPREYLRQEELRGRRHAFEHLSARRTALIVIDMVPFFVSQSGYCRGIVNNIVRIATHLRAARGVVAWVVPGNEQANLLLAQEFFGREVAELYRTSGGGGPLPSRLWPALQPDAHDLYFEKSMYSAFFPGSSTLPAALQRLGIDTVLIAGTLTNICCESSARDANALGYRVIMIADATAARRDQDHNATLHNIYRTFGDVRPMAEVIGLIASQDALENPG